MAYKSNVAPMTEGIDSKRARGSGSGLVGEGVGGVVIFKINITPPRGVE